MLLEELRVAGDMVFVSRPPSFIVVIVVAVRCNGNDAAVLLCSSPIALLSAG